MYYMQSYLPIYNEGLQERICKSMWRYNMQSYIPIYKQALQEIFCSSCDLCGEELFRGIYGGPEMKSYLKEMW